MAQKLSFVDIEMQNSLETKASTFRLYSECYEKSNSEIGNESFLWKEEPRIDAYEHI